MNRYEYRLTFIFASLSYLTFICLSDSMFSVMRAYFSLIPAAYNKWSVTYKFPDIKYFRYSIS
jgi:hypothetical protein